MAQDLSWNEILRMFRMLGGTAENIEPKNPGTGRGLVARISEQPVHVRVPPNLLFRVEDVEFENDRFRLKKSADAGEAERFFFESYQRGMSWEAGGRSESLSFVNALDSLPDGVRSLLAEEFGFEDLLDGDSLERAQKRFLKSRSVRLGEAEFIAPVIELANHSVAGLLSSYADGGLAIQGTVEEEVLVTYGIHDSMSLFQTFGLVSREPGAFSQSMEAQLQTRKLLIFQDRSSPVMRGTTWGPRMDIEGGTVVLPFLMIGHRAMPKQPRSIFRALAADAKIGEADEVFDSILRFNWAAFLNLLTALEAHDGNMVVTLRTVARYQLEAISHCIGSIEIEAPKPAKEEVWSLSIQ
jgi:hypothetical protein